MTDKLNRFLFTYGSLRKKSGHPMRQMLSKNAEWMGEAEFQGKLYMVEDFPGAIRSSDPDDILKGDLFRLNQPSVLLKKLDHYEGFDPDHREQSLFVREKEHVKMLPDRKPIRAWIYFYNKSVSHLRQIESGDYLDYIRK